jgi:phosphoglycolate phosphatase-like HAD superfamily hydrolase
MHICLFDIDGTLISSAGAGKRALEAALAAEFGVGRISDGVSLSGRTDRAILRDLFGMHLIEDTADNVRRFLDAYVAFLPGCLASSPGRVLPGIAVLLERLHGRDDVALGLLTGNIQAGARAKLGHYRLDAYFAFGGYGDDHFDRDDVAREALTEVHRRYREAVRPERIWVIGDTPLDIRCARAIGARAVAVCTGWHSREELADHAPDLLLDDLTDAAPWLDRWLTG